MVLVFRARLIIFLSGHFNKGIGFCKKMSRNNNSGVPPVMKSGLGPAGASDPRKSRGMMVVLFSIMACLMEDAWYMAKCYSDYYKCDEVTGEHIALALKRQIMSPDGLGVKIQAILMPLLTQDMDTLALNHTLYSNELEDVSKYFDLAGRFVDENATITQFIQIIIYQLSLFMGESEPDPEPESSDSSGNATSVPLVVAEMDAAPGQWAQWTPPQDSPLAAIVYKCINEMDATFAAESVAAAESVVAAEAPVTD